MSESRPDPRKRPPDPAGTQPKVDPESLRAGAVDAQLALPNPLSNLAAGAALAPLPADAQLGALAPTGASAASTARATPHAPRFQFLFGALGALSVTAVALAIALLRGPAAAPERPWSAWRPASDNVDPAEQIAAYVAPQYRLPDGKQIVGVVGGPPTLKGQPLTVGVIHSGQTPAPLEGNNVLYQLCGDGQDCSIKEGKPSTQRGLLVAREALELALYTFRYVSGVDRVLVTMPPPPPAGSTASSASSGAATNTAQAAQGSAASGSASATSRVVRHALIFTPQDLAPELGQPLSATLSTVTPEVSQMASWPDAASVKALTEPRLYDFTISETQQGLVMLLEPPGLGG